MPRRIRIYPYKQGSRSARALADALGGLVLRLENSRYRYRDSDLVINWGSSECPFDNGTYLNNGIRVRMASNKLAAFQAMQAGGVRVPEFWTNAEEIPEAAYEAGGVVCRTVLSGHSGRGIVLADSPADIVPAPLYTQYVKKQDEYRVHVVKRFRGTCNKIEQRLSCYECGYPEAEAAGSGEHLGPCDKGYEVICVQRKARRLEHDDPNWRIRNHANGFVFARDGVDPPDDVLEQARRSIISLGLDFGGVDVIWNEHQRRAYVLEVNTACGLEGSTVTDYANAFRRIFADA